MNLSSHRVTLRTPGDLLAAVPYLFGFQPRDSVVVVGLSGTRIVFSARADLPPSGAPADEIISLSDELGRVLADERAETALIVGFGEAARVTRTVLAVRDAVLGHGVDIGDILRATDGRYWSYLRPGRPADVWPAAEDDPRSFGTCWVQHDLTGS